MTRQHAHRIRQTADAARLTAYLVAMYAVILVLCLAYSPDPAQPPQTEQTTHAQTVGEPR